jgi:hypothetical protein
MTRGIKKGTKLSDSACKMGLSVLEALSKRPESLHFLRRKYGEGTSGVLFAFEMSGILDRSSDGYARIYSLRSDPEAKEKIRRLRRRYGIMLEKKPPVYEDSPQEGGY